jgi:hypothetical protein
MTPAASSTVWTGWDLRGGAAAHADGTAAFGQPVPHGEARYELLAVAGRGFRPPRYLTVASAGLETSAVDDAVLRLVWSLEYREIAATAPAAEVPHAIYLLGVNPPDGIDDAGLIEFNDFYTNVHLPEVAERRNALRAVRYELTNAIKPPYQGAPRFLAAYEVDEDGASHRRHVGPPYSSGPEVWQRHTTPWRLWYRVISPTPADH